MQIYFFILFCLIFLFFWFYLFIYLFLLEEQGANNYISWIWQSCFLLKMLTWPRNIVFKLVVFSFIPAILRENQFEKRNVMESLWGGVKFETTLWWLLKVFKIVKRWYILRFWVIPPLFSKYFFVYFRDITVNVKRQNWNSRLFKFYCRAEKERSTKKTESHLLSNFLQNFTSSLHVEVQGAFCTRGNESNFQISRTVLWAKLGKILLIASLIS